MAQALLALGAGRRDFSTNPSSVPSDAAHRATARELSTSAKSALLLSLAEYEQLPHLHSSPHFYRLFLYLAELSADEGQLETSLGFIQRADQLRLAAAAGSVSVLNHAHCLLLQQRMLNRLGRHSEEVGVCEQLLALSRARFSDPHNVSHRRGVPSCMYQLSLAYDSVGRREEAAELRRSALQLYQEYCYRQFPTPVPSEVQQTMGNIRSALGLPPADVEDLFALQQRLAREEQLHGMENIECSRTWGVIAAYHRQAGSYPLAVEAATEAVRIREASQGPQHCELIAPYKRLGDVHKQFQQHQLALAAYERAVDISLQQEAVDQWNVARVKVSMARCHFEMQQWEAAKRLYSEALPVFEVTEPDSRTWLQRCGGICLWCCAARVKIQRGRRSWCDGR